MKFRVWDSAEKEYVQNYIVWDSDGDLFIDSGTAFHPSEVLPLDKTFTIELNTGFTDSNGKEIFQNDLIHTPHTGQDSACMKKEGYDYHVDWAADKGQWMAYSYTLGFKTLFAPLFMVAKKSIITGRHDELEKE